MPTTVDARWTPFLERYSGGEWRAPVFRDMVLADAKELESQRGKLTFLDIGCGGGFDSDRRLQNSLAQVAGRFIGVEPDPDIELGDTFHDVHHCVFEEAPLEPDSIDIAYAVMVLEHLEHPRRFFENVHRVLKEGGVFWGFTVDARHCFVYASLLTERLRLKDWYLDRLHGGRGEERYENYGVFYQSNTPKQIEGLTGSFRSCQVLNFNKVGQMDFYLPRKLRWAGRAFDRVAMRMGYPGSILGVRVEK